MSDNMSACIKKYMDHGKNQDQAIAICYNELGVTKLQEEQSTPLPTNEQPTQIPKTKNKLELLAEFKKNIEKNGYKISDEILEGLIRNIQNGSEILKSMSFKLSLSDKKKQVIKVFPYGTFYFEKYDRAITFDDMFFNEVINNFNNKKLFKPYVDEDHKLEGKFAEITNLVKKEDGLYAELELNEIGIEAIKLNKYSYISPQWGDRVDTDKVFHKNVLWAITLTNVPAFEGVLPKLQEQIKLNKLGGSMYNEEKLITLKARCETYKLQNEVDPNKLMPLIEELLKMFDEMKAKIVEATGQAQQSQEQMAQAQMTIDKMKKSIEAKEKDEFFEKNVALGKIDIKEVEDFKEFYELNKEKVVSLVSKRPGKEDFQMTSSHINTSQLSKEDYSIMVDLNYNPEDPSDVRKYLEAIK